MGLVKTSFLFAIESILRLFCGFLIIKYLALQVGPSGVSKFLQLQNFVSVVLFSITGLFSTGLVKYIAEFQEYLLKQKQFIQAASFWSVIGSVILSLIIGGFAPFIANNILKHTQYTNTLYIFSLTLVFFSYNQLFQAIMNGKQHVKLLISCRMLNSVMMLGLTVFFIHYYALKGALIALVTVQTLVFPFTLFIMYRYKINSLNALIPKLHFPIIKKLSSYILMSIISAAVSPISLILIRNYIIKHLGWNIAGCWDAVWKISELYILVITTALSVYYLPVISKPLSNKQLQYEVKKVAIFTILCTSITGVSIYLLRDFLLWILFSPKFAPMIVFFPFMIVASVVRMIAWVYAYLMLAKSLITLYVVSEIVFTTATVLFVITSIKYFGLIGACYAYIIMYFCYFVFCYFFVYKKRLLRL